MLSLLGNYEKPTSAMNHLTANQKHCMKLNNGHLHSSGLIENNNMYLQNINYSRQLNITPARFLNTVPVLMGSPLGSSWFSLMYFLTAANILSSIFPSSFRNCKTCQLISPNINQAT